MAEDGPLLDQSVDGSGRTGRRVILGSSDVVGPSLIIVAARV